MAGKCIESHWRDAQIFSPWARLAARDIKIIAASGDWLALESVLQKTPRLSEAPQYYESAITELVSLRDRLFKESTANAQVLGLIDALIDAARRSAAEAQALLGRISTLAQTADTMFHSMDFAFLFDQTGAKLFSIGFRLLRRYSRFGCYDLLASEARLASMVAIAKGDAEPAHWFRLGRTLTPVGQGAARVSWSGSMFEYLRPNLVMRTPAESLLSETARLVRSAADRVRRRARRALGRFRIRIQRPGPRNALSILWLRRARTGP